MDNPKQYGLIKAILTLNNGNEDTHRVVLLLPATATLTKTTNKIKSVSPNRSALAAMIEDILTTNQLLGKVKVIHIEIDKEAFTYYEDVEKMASDFIKEGYHLIPIDALLDKEPDTKRMS